MESKNRRSFLVDILTGVAGAWLVVSESSLLGLFASGCDHMPGTVKYGGPPTPDDFGQDVPPPSVSSSPQESSGTETDARPMQTDAQVGDSGQNDAPADASSKHTASGKKDAGRVTKTLEHRVHRRPQPAKYGGPPRPPVVPKYGGPPRPPITVKYGGPSRPPM